MWIKILKLISDILWKLFQSWDEGRFWDELLFVVWLQKLTVQQLHIAEQE